MSLLQSPTRSSDPPLEVSWPRAGRHRSRPIRVCYLIDNLAVGGTETHLLGLIQQLDRASVQPYLCLLDGTGHTSRSFEPNNCPVMRLGVRSLYRPAAVVAATKFVSFLRREKIDVVQLYFPDSTYFGAPLARLAGVRAVIRTRRNLGYWMTRRHRLAGRVITRLVHATIVNSQACKAAVIKDEGAPPDSVVVIPNGIDLSRFQHIPPYTPDSTSSHRRIGIVANLRPIKNIDVFIRAAAIVVADYPDAHFLIAGEGPCRDSLTTLIHELGLKNHVQLLGQVVDIPSFLGSLDVAVLCSESEGLSNALLEYMAAGRPLVATAVGGNCDLIEDGVRGLLVQPNAPRLLAAKIREFCDAPGWSAAMAHQARAFAYVEHDATKITHRLVRVYCTLMACGVLAQ